MLMFQICHRVSLGFSGVMFLVMNGNFQWLCNPRINHSINLRKQLIIAIIESALPMNDKLVGDVCCFHGVNIFLRCRLRVINRIELFQRGEETVYLWIEVVLLSIDEDTMGMRSKPMEDNF